MIDPLGFHHVALLAADVERVAAFYREILGLPELARFHHADGRLRSVWVGVRKEGGVAGGFLAVEGTEAPPPNLPTRGYAMVALSIDPAARQEVRSTLESRGLAIDRETDFTLYVRDPEGNLVGLSHYPVARNR